MNQYTKSGRYIVDEETILNDDFENDILKTQMEEYAGENPKVSISDYKDELELAQQKLFKLNVHDSIDLSKEDCESILKYGIQAPSGGNVQPWSWVYKNSILLLFNDPNRSSSVLNYNNTGSLLSFGAALENIHLAAENKGLQVHTKYFPLGNDNNLMASLRFSKRLKQDHPYPNLVNHVFKRCTNRNLGARIQIKDSDLAFLKASVETIPGAGLKLFTKPNDMESFKSILGEIDKQFMTNQTGHAHFTKEIRWNQQEVEHSRDGIDINTIDLTPTERAGLILSRNWNVTKHIKKWRLGNEFGKLSQKAVDAASCLGMITMPSRSNLNYFEAGKAVQRLWLASTQLDITLQPMSISSFLFARIDDDNFTGIEEIRDGICEQYERVKQTANLHTGEKDMFFFRLSKAAYPEVLALPRNIDDVFTYV